RSAWIAFSEKSVIWSLYLLSPRTDAYSGLVRIVYSQCSDKRSASCLRRNSRFAGAAWATSRATRTKALCMGCRYGASGPTFRRCNFPSKGGENDLEVHLRGDAGHGVVRGRPGRGCFVQEGCGLQLRAGVLQRHLRQARLEGGLRYGGNGRADGLPDGGNQADSVHRLGRDRLLQRRRLRRQPDL